MWLATATKCNGVWALPGLFADCVKHSSRQSDSIDRRRVQCRLPCGCIGDHGLDRAVALLRQQEFTAAHLEGVGLDQYVLEFVRTVTALISQRPAKSLNIGLREGD